MQGWQPKDVFGTYFPWLCGGLISFLHASLALLRFKGAVQFNNNQATEFGGGLAVEGGDVT